MIEIGHYQALRVLRDTSVGLYLGDDEGEEVLLPRKYVPAGAAPGALLDVFVYKDGQHRKVATTLKPAILRDQFAWLQVAYANEYGAFLAWGLEKDLFVPFSEQPVRMAAGEWHLVRMYLDEASQRLIASARVRRFLSREAPPYAEGDAVEVLICGPNELGYPVIVEDQFSGMVYHSELFTQVQPGERRRGYVRQVRSDHKLDISLHQPGPDQIEPNARRILDALEQAGGFLPLHDSSPPEEIYKQLEMSKKSFKKAVGALYRQRLIRLAADGISEVPGE